MRGRRWFVLVVALVVLMTGDWAVVTVSQGGAAPVICERVSILTAPDKEFRNPRIAVENVSDGILLTIAWDQVPRESSSSNKEVGLMQILWDVNQCKEKARYGPFNISKTNEGTSETPAVALTSATTGLIVWKETTQRVVSTTGRNESVSNILLRRFAIDKNMEDTSLGNLEISESDWATAESPNIAADRFANYVVWTQYNPEKRVTDILLRSSAPFAPKVNITNGSTGMSQLPTLAVDPIDPSKLYVVWQGEMRDGSFSRSSTEIFLSEVRDAGKSFVRPVVSDPHNISNTPSRSSWEPAIAFERTGALVVVWSDDSTDASSGKTDSEILFRRSTEGLRPNFSISENCQNKSLQPQPSRQPTVATDGRNNVVVAWQERVGEHTHIYFARSPFRADFRPGQPQHQYGCINITAPSNPGSKSHIRSERPAIGVDSMGYTYVVWQGKQDPNSPDEIYLAVIKP